MFEYCHISDIFFPCHFFGFQDLNLPPCGSWVHPSVSYNSLLSVFFSILCIMSSCGCVSLCLRMSVCVWSSIASRQPASPWRGAYLCTRTHAVDCYCQHKVSVAPLHCKYSRNQWLCFSLHLYCHAAPWCALFPEALEREGLEACDISFCTRGAVLPCGGQH